MANHNNFCPDEAGRDRHSVRAVVCLAKGGAHGVTRPATTGLRQGVSVAWPVSGAVNKVYFSIDKVNHVGYRGQAAPTWCRASKFRIGDGQLRICGFLLRQGHGGQGVL